MLSKSARLRKNFLHLAIIRYNRDIGFDTRVPFYEQCTADYTCDICYTVSNSLVYLECAFL